MIDPADRAAAEEMFGYTGLTYDDVLLLPDHTDVVPSEVDTATRLTRGITAGRAAGLGGDGHRDRVPDGHRHGPPGRHRGPAPQPVDRRPGRARSTLVKRTESGMIHDPVTVSPDATVARARRAVRALPRLRPAGRRRRSHPAGHRDQPRPAVPASRALRHDAGARRHDAHAPGHRPGGDPPRGRGRAAGQAQDREAPPGRRRRPAHRADHGQGLRQVREVPAWPPRTTRAACASGPPSASSATPGSGPPPSSRPASTCSSPTPPTATRACCWTWCARIKADPATAHVQVIGGNVATKRRRPGPRRGRCGRGQGRRRPGLDLHHPGRRRRRASRRSPRSTRPPWPAGPPACR